MAYYAIPHVKYVGSFSALNIVLFVMFTVQQPLKGLSPLSSLLFQAHHSNTKRKFSGSDY